MAWKKIAAVVAFCLLIVVVLWLMSLDRPISEKKLKTAVEGYRTMEGLLKSDPPDFAAAMKVYREKIMPAMEWIDKEYDLETNYKVIDSMERGLSGSIPRINAVITDKLTQRGFFTLIEGVLTKVKEEPQKKNKYLPAIETALPALNSPIKQGETWLGEKGLIDSKIRLTYKSLLDGPPEPQNVNSYANTILRYLTGLYVANLLEALTEIEKTQANDKIGALTAMAEGKMIYYMLYKEHAEIDRPAAIMFMGEFSKVPKEVDIPEMRKTLKNAFVLRIPELTADRFAGTPTTENENTEPQKKTEVEGAP